MTSAARRELAVAVVVLAVVLGATYAMTRVFLDPAWVRPTVAAAALSVVTTALTKPNATTRRFRAEHLRFVSGVTAADSSGFERLALVGKSHMP